MERIVVIGGTGLIGSKVVEKLQILGHDVLAAAPATGVNTITGEGLADAMLGAEIVVDVSNSPSLEEKAAMAFFDTAGRNVAAAEAEADVRHHVALSVVGTDRLQDSGYFRAKLAQERFIRESGTSYTIIRATQFFEFLRAIADSATIDGAVRLPPVQFQPMSADNIAKAIADAALSNPANGIVEIGGPERFTLDEPVRMLLAADRDPRPVIADPEALYFGVHVEHDTLVPGPAAHLGSTTLAWWMEHVPSPSLHEAA